MGQSAAYGGQGMGGGTLSPYGTSSASQYGGYNPYYGGSSYSPFSTYNPYGGMLASTPPTTNPANPTSTTPSPTAGWRPGSEFNAFPGGTPGILQTPVTAATMPSTWTPRYTPSATAGQRPGSEFNAFPGGHPGILEEPSTWNAANASQPTGGAAPRPINVNAGFRAGSTDNAYQQAGMPIPNTTWNAPGMHVQGGTPMNVGYVNPALNPATPAPAPATPAPAATTPAATTTTTPAAGGGGTGSGPHTPGWRFATA